MYRTSPRFPPVYLFFFGVQNRFFFCPAKEKVVLAPAGQAKNQLQDKASHFSHKRKGGFPPRGTPIRKEAKPGNIRPPPENHPPGGVDTNEQGAVSPPQRQWRKRTHGSLKRRPPETEEYPKGFYPRDTITAQHQRPVVPSPVIISTGPPFLFRSPEPLFLLHAKEKVVLAPAGQADKQPLPGRQKTTAR